MFGDMVRNHRRRLSLTQEELAVKAGLSTRAVRYIESGRITRPRPATVRMLAEVLGFSAAESAVALELESTEDVPADDSDRGRPVPAQLPPDVTGFTGRAEHLDRLRALLDRSEGGTAVVTSAIAGTAGVGKTSLAVHFAHRVAGHFPDGHLYVNLRGFHAREQHVETTEAVRGFLEALGVDPAQIPDDLDARVGLYRSLLFRRRVLVLLDNARDPAQVRPLLPGAPGCLVLITSRDSLSGLVASAGAHPINLDVPSAAEARELLATRLGAARAAAEPDAVDAIVSRCARLPLALAVVAARAAARPRIPLATLAAELGEAPELDALAGSDPDTDVRVAFSWSYRQLDAAEARLFRLIGLHPGAELPTAAAAALGDLTRTAARRLLTNLAAAHLVAEIAPDRYGLHDLLRAYSAEQVRVDEPSHARQAAVRRVSDHYLRTAIRAAMLINPARDPIESLFPLDVPASDVPLDVPASDVPASAGAASAGAASSGGASGGPDDATAAWAWLAAEHATLLPAIRLTADAGLDTHAWQLAWAVSDYFQFRGFRHEDLTATRIGLDAASRAGDIVGRVRMHLSSARALIALGSNDEARVHLRLAGELYRDMGDSYGLGLVHLNTGYLLGREERHLEALEENHQALSLFRAVGNRQREAVTLSSLGDCQVGLGEYRSALGYCEDAVAALHAIGDRGFLASALDTLGSVLHHLGEYDRAIERYEAAVVMHRETGDRFYEADSLTHLGDTLAATGNTSAADTAWRHALEILDELKRPEAAAVRKRLTIR